MGDTFSGATGRADLRRSIDKRLRLAASPWRARAPLARRLHKGPDVKCGGGATPHFASAAGIAFAMMSRPRALDCGAPQP